jgi:NAD(P)H-nitrite reductase large subunit
VTFVLPTDDTIVCRCEDVTARQILDRIQAGVVDIEGLKAVIRMSMGHCQGWNCLVLSLR